MNSTKYLHKILLTKLKNIYMNGGMFTRTGLNLLTIISFILSVRILYLLLTWIAIVDHPLVSYIALGCLIAFISMYVAILNK